MTAQVIGAAAAGAFTWTLLEYVIHRWMGHHRRFKRTPFGVEHIRHHIEGDYFSPAWKKVVAAALASAALIGPAVLLVGGAAGTAYVAGLACLYGVYEVVHHRLHTSGGAGRYGHFLRRHHFRHHLIDGRANHGVTSPLWDHVFRTYRRSGRIVVPPKLAMVWLLDPATGRVRPEHSATYAIGRAKGAA